MFFVCCNIVSDPIQNQTVHGKGRFFSRMRNYKQKTRNEQSEHRKKMRPRQDQDNASNTYNTKPKLTYTMRLPREWLLTDVRLNQAISGFAFT